ncbi:MAG: hypothetical protein RIS94_2734 [Pseudomonadota bacterium]|jgi:hypothetical protein
MIRTKTTLVIGAGASCELQMPSGEDLLARVVAGYDFSRLGTPAQSRESQFLIRHLLKQAERMNRDQNDVVRASQLLRNAARVGRAIDTVIEQVDHDALAVACGKIAIAFHIGQAETRATLREAPRQPGELPLLGKPDEQWLFWLGQLLTAGLPRTRLERAFEDLTIVCFNYDRAIEHYLPHALVMAYGLDLKDAQRIVGERLRILHPYGSVGRLPWQPGQEAQAEWAGSEQPWNIHAIAGQIRTHSERMADTAWLHRLRQEVGAAKRLVFLGTGFHPRNLELLFDRTISHNPEVLATTYGLSPGNRLVAARMLRRGCGLEHDELLTLTDARAFEALRDNALLLES